MTQPRKTMERCGWMRLRSPLLLAEARRSRRYSQRALGTAAGVSHTTIQLLENGKMTTCTPELAGKIEQVLGSSPGFLFEQRGDIDVPALATGKSSSPHPRRRSA